MPWYYLKFSHDGHCVTFIFCYKKNICTTQSLHTDLSIPLDNSLEMLLLSQVGAQCSGFW